MSILTNHAVESSSFSYSTPLCHRFTFPEIERATQNFDEFCVIGSGGFGKVYRGTITCGDDVLDAAIKRLESTSSQGAVEFRAEVKMLSKLRHSHLVSLIGYCDDGQEMIIVYEYMPNGTLADWLHKYRAPLTWVQRLNICIGAARGLNYLHDDMDIKPIVIHRDVKSSNILLDANWEAKISDFGLSKIGPTNQPSTYVNTLVRGTFGYMDPDYFQTGRLTRKSDVYAFGVVLFEVLCGKQAVDRSIGEEHWGLATWAQDSIKEGRLEDIVDSNLKGLISRKCLKQFALLANRCLHSHPKQRPTMAEVVAGLESILAIREKPASILFYQFFGRRGPTSALSPLLKIPERNNVVFFDYAFHHVNLEDLLVATVEVLGKGSVGTSYKQILEKKNSMVVVKRLKDVKVTENEFKKTMDVLGKVKNENLVPLIAYYYSKNEKLLVYDYMGGGSLSAHLHGSIGLPRTRLVWERRMQILVSVAKGLAYLHEAGLVHGNIKSSNIFMPHETNNYEACLSENGLNMLFVESSSLNHDAAAYQAPEVGNSCKLTFHSDVYSFGVLLVELLTGKNPKQAKLVESVVCEEPRVAMIDPELRMDCKIEKMMELLNIAKDCVSIVPDQRPTMQELSSMMERYWWHT